MKKYTKMISLVLALVLMIMISMTTFTFATDPANYKGDRNNVAAIESIGNRILGIVQVIGSIAAVIILVVLGIKYMMGSAEEKAEYKKTMIPYIIGAILIFAASNLASMIYSWANTITV